MGKLYVIEGPDASGKTSTANALRKSIYCVNPGLPKGFWDMPAGRDPEEFFLQRSLESELKIKQALEKGNIITARYTLYSLPAITYAKTGERIIPDSRIMQPDKIIYLSPTYTELRRRLQQRVDNGIKLNVYEKDETMYKRLIQRYEELFENDPRVMKLDNTGRTVEDVVKELVLKFNSS